MDTFKTKLKELRTEKKLTQKSLAEALLITTSTLSHWECGYQEPSFKDLLSICDYFECSIDYLLGRADDFGNITIQQKSPAPTLTQAEQDLLNDFRSLPCPEQAQASEYVHFLAQRRENHKKKA